MAQKISYSRFECQIDVPEIGMEGQKKLAQASVLIVGLGGLGCPAALYLTAAGIGRIGLADQDVVSLTNLQRQILYREADVNKSKVDIAAQELQELAAASVIEKYPLFISKDNAAAVLKTYDIVLDCTDNFEARYLLNYICFTQRKPLVSASLYHHDGQVMLFTPFKGEGHPCYQCLYPQTRELDIVPQCREGGVVGPVAGVTGTLQASVTLNALLGIGEGISGAMVTFDALRCELKKIAMEKRPDCEVCGPEYNRFTLQTILDKSVNT